jgi:hypothetical protein
VDTKGERMTNVGDLGHVTDGHNDLEADIRAEAARFGVQVTLSGPFAEGAQGHVEAHNAERAALQAIATAGAITVTLPDLAKLGDSGHVADHDAMRAALAVIAAAPAYNSITGGTITTVNEGGKKFRVHTYKAGTTITVTAAAKPFWVLLAGGGFDGANGDYSAYGGGGGGFYENKNATLPTGSLTVTVGARNGGSSSIATYSAEGAKGGNGIPGAGGGAGAGNGGQGAEGPRSTIDGTDRGYCGGGSSVNWNYCCDPCCFGGTANNSGGGSGRDCAPQAWYYGGGGGRAQHTCGTPGTGYQGVVIVRYEIV